MSDIEIARKANKKNIKEIAIKLNLEENDLRPYGHHIAKIDNNSTQGLPKKESKLILVTAISPTPGEKVKLQLLLVSVMVSVKLENKALCVCVNQVLALALA